ncbi:MAG: DUF3551 domain-containing protein [Bradyrhizobium sp.]
MRLLALTALTVGFVLAAGQTRAQTYDPAFPVCMYIVTWGGGGRYDCTFHTMAQCAATASGLAALCDPNPYYMGPKASPKRKDRTYR